MLLLDTSGHLPRLSPLNRRTHSRKSTHFKAGVGSLAKLQGMQGGRAGERSAEARGGAEDGGSGGCGVL
jgi:hypothetical protein